MQLSIRLCLLLIISIGAALSTLTHANNTFWEDQSNQDSFLGLPANAEISDLNLKIIKQSAKYVYLTIVQTSGNPLPVCNWYKTNSTGIKCNFKLLIPLWMLLENTIGQITTDSETGYKQ